jgi:hypothetical protein
MSVDLSKAQFSSTANSFKNNGTLYSGSVVFPTSIASGSFSQSSQTVTLDAAPEFSMLYAYFQDFSDSFQQFLVGSGYNTAQWYQSTVNTKAGVVVTAPAPQAGVLQALIYPVINGNTVTVIGLINNPYSVAITLQALTVPWRFIIYTMTN